MSFVVIWIMLVALSLRIQPLKEGKRTDRERKKKRKRDRETEIERGKEREREGDSKRQRECMHYFMVFLLQSGSTPDKGGIVQQR